MTSGNCLNLGVIYGAHGEHERLSVELGHSLNDDPIAYVTPIEGNPKAMEAGERYIETNLVNAKPDASSFVYEEREAARIVEEIQNGNFDAVIDFHTTRAPHNDAIWVQSNASPLVFQIARFLHIPDIIIGNHPTYFANYTDGLIVDVSEHPDNKLYEVKNWRYALKELTTDFHEFNSAGECISKLRIWRHIGTLTATSMNLALQDAPDIVQHLPYRDQGPSLLDGRNDGLVYGSADNTYPRKGCVYILGCSTNYLDYEGGEGPFGELIVPAYDHREGGGIYTPSLKMKAYCER